MPPVIIKTYQHKPKKKKRPWAAICNIHDRKDGEDPKTTFDTLFSENIKQQKKILKEKKNIKVKYSSPVPKKAPLRFTSTDDEGAFESTFDRILKAPVLQQAEPLDVNKNSDFASSSSDMRSSSSGPSYDDLSLFPVKKKNTKSRAGEEPPVLRRSRASLKKINKETNKDSCLTSTPMMKKCENKLYVALSPVQGTRINTLSNRALKDNNSIVSSRTRSHLKMSIRKSKMGAHGYVSTVFCDENNESPERISNENVQVSEMSECVSSLENLRLETSRNEFLFSKVVSTLKNPEKLQVEHNESMLKESNGELSNEVQTSLNIDTTNNVQKNSDEAAQRLNSPVMFDSWDAGKKNSLRASSGACDMVEPRNVASGPNGLLLDFKGFEDEETTAAASSAVALLSYFDLSEEICSNEMLGDSFVKSSFNRLPCRRQSLMVVPSDVMISRFKLPSFSDVYRKTIHQNSTTNLETNFTKSETEEDEDGDGDRNGKISLSDSLLAGTSTVFTAKDAILQRCNQEDIILFSKAYTKSYWKTCRKIGEGVYGEVFMSDGEDRSVLKIIPIEGSELVNGEPQKKFEEILSEIVIAMELSNLRHGEENRTQCFSEMKRCLCVKGKYPEHLIRLWNDYDDLKGSENDSPEMFNKDQLYIILELANGGSDLESYEFFSAHQSLSILIQIACALAVAERELQFEHRDLHWGNVLISRTKEKNVVFRLDNEEHIVRTKGVQATIIDFTLSRMKYDGCVIFNDLSKDPSLFTAEGDYQFEIYRLMKKHTKNQWNTFVPHTNILWLHYLADKMINMVKYSKKSTKGHRNAIGTLQQIKDMLLYHNSTPELVLTYNLHDI